LAHPPGEALVVIGGVEQKGHFLCVDLPHSDDSFVVMFPAENTEAFCEGHNQAFAYLGGVPRTMLYDNTAIAVKEITGDGERKPTEEFSRLQSHYLFAAKFGRPAAAGAEVVGARRDHCGTFSARPGAVAAAAGSAVRSVREASGAR
jgi:transposase